MGNGCADQEPQAIRGTALSRERDEDGFYYFVTEKEKGASAWSPIVARNEERRKQWFLLYLDKLWRLHVFSNRLLTATEHSWKLQMSTRMEAGMGLII